MTGISVGVASRWRPDGTTFPIVGTEVSIAPDDGVGESKAISPVSWGLGDPPPGAELDGNTYRTTRSASTTPIRIVAESRHSTPTGGGRWHRLGRRRDRRPSHPRRCRRGDAQARLDLLGREVIGIAYALLGSVAAVIGHDPAWSSYEVDSSASCSPRARTNTRIPNITRAPKNV